jgi:hypothetical protein
MSRATRRERRIVFISRSKHLFGRGSRKIDKPIVDFDLSGD